MYLMYLQRNTITHDYLHVYTQLTENHNFTLSTHQINFFSSKLVSNTIGYNKVQLGALTFFPELPRLGFNSNVDCSPPVATGSFIVVLSALLDLLLLFSETGEFSNIAMYSWTRSVFEYLES